VFKKKKINKKNLTLILNDIEKYSPHPQKVNILAVTKNLDFSAIESSTQNELFNIGENKVQETEKKTLNKELHYKTQLHFIGPIQTNKIKKAVQIYDVIQSVSRLKELKKISLCSEKIKKKQKIFLQINISKAKTQKGFLKEEIIKIAEKAKEMPYIKNIGIMAIGENSNNPKNIKKNFIDVKKIQKKIQRTIDVQCTELSIGMSKDYKIALETGATFIRLGTKLFAGEK